MLREYFRIDIDPSGALQTLPLVLDQYSPDLDRLPQFALRLGNDVSIADSYEMSGLQRSPALAGCPLFLLPERMRIPNAFRNLPGTWGMVKAFDCCRARGAM